MDVAQVLDPLAPSRDDTSNLRCRRSYAAHITHFSSHLLPPIIALLPIQQICWGSVTYVFSFKHVFSFKSWAADE
jgi:hypothetical protein